MCLIYAVLLPELKPVQRVLEAVWRIWKHMQFELNALIHATLLVWSFLLDTEEANTASRVNVVWRDEAGRRLWGGSHFVCV